MIVASYHIAPPLLIGCRILSVIDYDIDERAGGQARRVRYDDSDEEDLYEGELRPLLN